LILTNETLKSMGLKSLTEIYKKYAKKKHLILKKNKKKLSRNDQIKLNNFTLNYSKNIDKFLLLAITKAIPRTYQKRGTN